MAPIQTYTSSFANQSSAFDMAPRVCRCGGLSKSCDEFWLPISRRGHFFHDSFFGDVHTYFDSAIREILDRWNNLEANRDEFQCSGRSPDSLNLYRQLRSQKGQDQASTVVSDNRTHKVVIDVQDFMEGDIKVKVLGEKEVVVECLGSDTTAEGSLSSSRRFCRRFAFPSSVNMAEITSVISSDGVLTIEAPKVGTVHSQVASDESSASSSESVLSENSSGSDKSDVVYYCKGCNKKIGGSWHAAPEIKTAQRDGVKVPIKINASRRVSQNTSTLHQEAHSDTGIQTEQVNVEAKGQAVKESVKTKAMAKDSSLQEANTSDNKMKGQCQIQNNNYEVPVTTSFSLLPVSVRGPFFSDSFFRDTRKDFQSAVQEVLSKWGGSTFRLMEEDDDLCAYRRLRLHNLKEETQAVKTTEDESCCKFVLDVQDFINGGEVMVKAIGDREIVVEGCINREDGGSRSLQRFVKRFRVPGNVSLDSISSVMSSDGVLTITAPKKSLPAQPKEVIIPVSVEGYDGSQTATTILSSTSAKTTSSTKMDQVQNQARASNEHIIPINIEGEENTRVNREMCKQKETQSGHTTSTLQKNRLSREYIIPINVEGTSNDSESTATESKSRAVVQTQDSRYKNSTEQTQKSRASVDRIIPINVEADKDEILVSKQQQTLTHRTTRDRIIPVALEGTSVDVNTNTFDRQAQVQKEVHEDSLKSKQHIAVHKTTEHQVNSGNEFSYMKNKQEDAEVASRQEDKCQFAHQRAQSKCSETKNVVSNQHLNNLTCYSSKRYLPISRRGLFLEDTYFMQYQNDFQAAVKDVLIKCKQCADVTDYMAAYRSLRKKELKVENQALYAQEDQESFKIAVDAKDFVNGDITVFVDGEELVIEGKAENSEVKSSNSLTFSHRFLLPESFNITTISSAISSDGILTVNCPKAPEGGSGGIRRMSTEARSEQESHHDGGRKWEEKRVKESSEQAGGYSSRIYSSSYSSLQQNSSAF